MIWQDIIIAFINIAFSIFLIPQFIGFREKDISIKFQAFIPTFMGLCMAFYIYYALSLLYSSMAIFIIGIAYLILFIYRLVSGK